MRRHESRREQVTHVIGDLNGSYYAYMENLYALDPKVVEWVEGQLHWIGGNQQVVFLGDILMDRIGQGFEILLDIKRLRLEAQAAGGDIKVLAGNHDDLFISYAIDTATATHYPAHENMFHFSSRSQADLDELLDFCEDEWMAQGLTADSLAKYRKKILKTMRASEKGSAILEEIGKMQLFERAGNALLQHVAPTHDIVDWYIKKHSFLETMQEVYSGTLSQLMKNRDGVHVQDLVTFIEAKSLFLSGLAREPFHMRYPYIAEEKAKMLIKEGTRVICYGHNLYANEPETIEKTDAFYQKTGLLALSIDTGFGRIQGKREAGTWRLGDDASECRSIVSLFPDGHVVFGTGYDQREYQIRG